MKRRNPWLVWHRTCPEAHARLLCFSYAGGSATTYADWCGHLPPGIEVCAVQLPGRGSRFTETPMRSLKTELLPVLMPALAFSDEIPCYLFGHSLGALIAFEVARHGRLRGVPKFRGLIVSGCSAPQDRGERENIHLLDDHALIEKLMSYNGTPPEVIANRELMDIVLPAVRADFALSEKYTYEPGLMLDIPLAVFVGADDIFVAGPQIDGWQLETTNTCDVYGFDGDHFFVDTQRASVVERVGAIVHNWNENSSPKTVRQANR